MIIEDIAELFTELDEGEESQTQIAKHFGRSRKFIPLIKSGCTFNLDYGFIAGLDYYGYELKLVKKGVEE